MAANKEESESKLGNLLPVVGLKFMAHQIVLLMEIKMDIERE
jgi:hypothetical protein